MADSTVLTLMSQLSSGQADSTIAPTLYDDVVRDLGRQPWLSNSYLLSTTSSSSPISLPDTYINLYASTYEGRWLGQLSLREAEYLSPDWRDIQGFPQAFITEGETRKNLQLFPYPNLASTSSLAVFVSEYRGTLPTWLQWPVTLLCLGLEFMRASDHEDQDMAQACTQLGQLLLKAVA